MLNKKNELKIALHKKETLLNRSHDQFWQFLFRSFSFAADHFYMLSREGEKGKKEISNYWLRISILIIFTIDSLLPRGHDGVIYLFANSLENTFAHTFVSHN